MPRLIAAFLLYVGLVFAPDIGDAVSRVLDAVEEATESVPTPVSPARPSPSPSPLREVVPHRLATRWVLDQPHAGELDIVVIGGVGSQLAIAQTFRSPADDLALTSVAPRMAVLIGAMRVSVFELSSLDPSSGRRLYTRVVDLDVVLGEGYSPLELRPPVRLRSGRTYALVLRSADPRSSLAIRYLAGESVYVGGAMWFQDHFDTWRPQVGEMSFRLEFDVLEP